MMYYEPLDSELIQSKIKFALHYNLVAICTGLYLIYSICFCPTSKEAFPGCCLHLRACGIWHQTLCSLMGIEKGKVWNSSCLTASLFLLLSQMLLHVALGAKSCSSRLNGRISKSQLLAGRRLTVSVMA